VPSAARLARATRANPLTVEFGRLGAQPLQLSPLILAESGILRGQRRRRLVRPNRCL